jgi:hypothetical protein
MTRATVHPLEPCHARIGYAARSRSIAAISALALVAVCGCSPQPKKAEAPVLPPPDVAKVSPAVHRARIVHAAKVTRHDLSEAEKDKIFQGFERWLATRSQEPASGVPLGRTDREAGASERPVE